jgi:hypothetical protein
MDRESAETYLRLLAEAAIRGSLAPARGAPWGSGTSSEATILTVGRALGAVGAIDVATVEEILTDLNLAVRVRQVRGGPASTARWVVQGPSMSYVGLGPAGLPARAGPTAAKGEAEDAEDGWFVPVGLTVPFRDGAISGDLCLMSFAQTSAGARFIAAWDVRTRELQTRLGLESSGLIPFEEFTVTDDRGARYGLDAKPGSDPQWASEISLRPAPPQDIRWLDIAAPGHAAVRVRLDPGGAGGVRGGGHPRAREVPRGRASHGGSGGMGPPGEGSQQGLRPAGPPAADDRPQVSDTKLSPGEHLLVMMAERLLTTAPGVPVRLGQRAAAPSARLRAMAAGLGDVVGALEAADVLSPLSPVPARLATLCASLDLDGHGITVPPTAVLPEPWLSLLAHFQRRKPEPAPMRDGYAPLAAALPELDGIRLALLGLLHAEASTSLYVLARGPERDHRYGPLDIDLAFPLSVWLRDSGGRWHAARSDRRHRGGRENTIRLQLVPPLTRPAAWAEIIIGGQSAEVRTTLPLRWEYPS